MPQNAIDRAETLLQAQGRVLERRLFEFTFRGGAGSAVRDAVVAYRNPDGGFGHGLEPDVRSPLSAALHCEIALLSLAQAETQDPELADGVAGFLDSIAEPDGRVPIIGEAVLEAPHAAHWDHGLFPPPSPNPTASLAGLLAQQGSTHPWVERATRWIWARLAEPVESGHELITVAAFLAHTPDRARAEDQAGRVLAGATTGNGVHLAPGAAGYGVTPLQIFPRPDALGVDVFPKSTYDGFLDELAAAQQDDGGWPITFEPVNEACTAEWRARFTLEALTTLRAWGRL